MNGANNFFAFSPKIGKTCLLRRAGITSFQQFEKYFGLRLDVLAYAKDDVGAIHRNGNAICGALLQKHRLPLSETMLDQRTDRFRR
jgi:hypothetical protein